MGLSTELISQFVKATKDTTKHKSETTSYGTIVEEDGSVYVRLDGSDLLTPVSTTADIKDGERVTVMIKNHTAIVTGNITSPSARNNDVLELGVNVDDASKTATNFIKFTASDGVEIGNRSGGAWSGFRAQITSAAYNILNEAGEVLASYGSKVVELGKNATDAIVKLCGGKGTIEYVSDEDGDYVQVSAEKLRLKSDSMSSLYSMYTNESTRWEKSAVNVSPTEINMYASECVDPSLPDRIESWDEYDITIDPKGMHDGFGQFVSVDEGSSGIWHYRKFQNGNVELWGIYEVVDLECSATLGGLYRTDVLNMTEFPFTVYSPILVASYESSGYGAMLWATTETTDSAPPNYYLVRPTSATIANGKIIFHVRGKWTT